MNRSSILSVWLVGVSLSFGALAQQTPPSDPTPRKSMAPASATKVRIYEAKRWRNFGVDAEAVSQRVVATSAGQTRSCNTTIGPATSAPQTGYRQNGQADSTVIISGDVINVCK